MSKKPNINKHQEQTPESLTLTRQEFSGPIPPPLVLEQYQKILPTAPERIISMAEKQQNYRHSTTNKALKIKNKGQLYGFLLMVLIMFLSAYALFLGYEKFAIMGMIFVAVPLVKLFILGSKNQ
ncbi:MAG: DUF2335 domain-containing protein [Candidatus Thioglobus sp.]|nr:DUF2335 domain-containing protein [Candidatus Thioglobus sp.]